MPRVFCPLVQACCAQNVGEPNAGPFRAAHAAIGPLIAARGRFKRGAAIAAAFQHHAKRDRLEAFLQLSQRQRELVVNLAVNREFP